MAVTTRQPVGRPAPRWALLLRPRWLAWHSIVWVATVGMFFLGDWQLHRAESGNELSWAYTFEWPLFAIFTVFFWIKSLRDELRDGGSAASAGSESGRVDARPAGTAFPAAAADSGVAATVSAAVTISAPAVNAGAAEAGAAPAERTATAGRRADTWDATSWDATSWDATSRRADADGAAEPVDIARATPADGEAYMARLMAEVQRSGRRGRR
jgi:hypothetical protein